VPSLPADQPAPVDVRRAGDRFVTVAEGRTTRHSFSFDRHYDPANVAWGALLCHNDDVVAPGHGYPDHPHRELEILTWVLDGTLRHEDGSGGVRHVRPGFVQRLCAGTGVRHAETNDPGQPGPVRFVQMWVRPREPGLPPAYDLADVRAGLASGRWLTLASGVRGHQPAVSINADAALHVAPLAVGEAVALPDAPLLHLFVAAGVVDVEAAGALGAGDAARLTGGGHRVTARTDTEVLLWELRG
jgi:quercetin 2,3-dioxygenase